MATPEKSTKQHPSQMPFADLLSQFTGGEGAQIGSPYADSGMRISPALLQDVTTLRKKEDSKKKGSKGLSIDLDDRPLTDLDDFDEDILQDDDPIGPYNPDFDDLIETAFMEDEDVTLRNSLISMGRKYAVKGMEENAEVSEVNRAFAQQEQAIDDLMEESHKDEVDLQRDIDYLRASRTKSYKSLGDLVVAKTTLRRLRLDAIKERSSIKKTIFDINLKMKKDQATDAGDSGAAATQTIQKLFSMGRKNLIASEDEPDYGFTNDAAYEANQASTAIELSQSVPEAVSDGDLYIKYENLHPELVLDIDTETNEKQVYAITSDGDVIPDYPLPSNPENLHFNLNEISGEASDQLQRRYKMRRNGVDVISRDS